jgi:hypothetical protein
MGKTECAGGMTENKKSSAWRWRDGNESKMSSWRDGEQEGNMMEVK